jgi:hypothetical protein
MRWRYINWCSWSNSYIGAFKFDNQEAIAIAFDRFG